MNLKHFSAVVAPHIMPLQADAKRALRVFIKAIKTVNANQNSTTRAAHEMARAKYFAAADAYNQAVEA